MLEQMGSAFIFLGIALFFLGIVLTIAGKHGVKLEGGGAIFIGPFPIFLGATSKTALIITVVLSLVLILIFLMLGVVRW